MTITYIKTLVHKDLNRVNKLILSKLHSKIKLINNLTKYIIKNGGKRLRPLLVLLSSHSCGYKGLNHIKLAAMIEFFHTATLLHDDVIDESSLRRGHETANQIWGSKASILVGDYLFTQTIQIMVDVNHPKILKLLSDTSYQISCGEIKQLTNQYNISLSITEYFDIIKKKTALLFATSAAIGAFISNSRKKIIKNLYNYGLHLGNAFQLIDDALDYSLETEIAGKNIGKDFLHGKITFPLLYALKFGTKKQKKVICQNIKERNLKNFNKILIIIKKTKAIEATKKYAKTEILRAISYLKYVPESIYKNALKKLAYFSLNRNY
ncbi:octaprenyl diphosphate synthase [Candidatus Legionella polyplacis]|uniref:polyprenyl synthetase family protein n=1 Tax=Candidatus Legionella polyplacis TaxID=2005262 RepID=UPI000C1F0E98|nr:polyprenyl synthetase family protein [Candidatus Legionella polyplacis]ATW02063.1 octaprenyl diphosphate synthase [Candidatus Legionella polyplacis]